MASRGMSNDFVGSEGGEMPNRCGGMCKPYEALQSKVFAFGHL